MATAVVQTNWPAPKEPTQEELTIKDGLKGVRILNAVDKAWMKIHKDDDADGWALLDLK